jgi:hypothetical protein
MTANPNLASDQKSLGNKGASIDDNAKLIHLAVSTNPTAEWTAPSQGIIVLRRDNPS